MINNGDKMNDNIFKLIPECADSRETLKKLLYMIYPNEKIRANTILAAQDAGIVDKLINVRRIDRSFWEDFLNTLMNDYGLSAYYASWAISFWCHYYGDGVLDKYTTKDVKNEIGLYLDIEGDNKELSVQEPQPLHKIYLGGLKENEKLPKEILQWNAKEGLKLRIIRFHCAVRMRFTDYDEPALGFTGGFWGKEGEGAADLLFMVYNAEDELIGMKRIDALSLYDTGKQIFDFTISVPKDETVSRIWVKAIKG